MYLRSYTYVLTYIFIEMCMYAYILVHAFMCFFTQTSKSRRFHHSACFRRRLCHF